ncbi:HxsD-like protein [uncultured Faecalibaculum sp.]|uniref:HxsD-like protein n=1 Tax=uncultured Faecalibaculum sp. TaxID=1729681 RepID=UPI003444C109
MIEFFINKNVYSPSSIQKAISDYQALAKITADEQAGGKIRILINSTKLPEELVRNEFENYLIALENRQC